MRRFMLVFTVALAAPLAAQGQSSTAPSAAQRDSVLAPIRSLFDGMRTRDTTKMRSAFAAGALMAEPTRPGDPVKFAPVDGWIASIVKAPPGPAFDEQIYDPEVRIDGGLASVWTFYTFTAGDYSHCGVDAVHLVRTPQGWKISTIADTRRRTGCEVTGRTKG